MYKLVSFELYLETALLV